MKLKKLVNEASGIKLREISLSKRIFELKCMDEQIDVKINNLEKKLDETYVAFRDARVSGKSEQVQMAFAARYYVLDQSYAVTNARKLDLANLSALLENMRLNKTGCDYFKIMQSPMQSQSYNKLKELIKYLGTARHFETNEEYEAWVKKTYEMLCARVDAELEKERNAKMSSDGLEPPAIATTAAKTEKGEK